MILKNSVFLQIVAAVNFLLIPQTVLAQEKNSSATLVPVNIKTSVSRSVFRIVGYSTANINNGIYKSIGSSVLWNQENNTCSLITASHVLKKNPGDTTTNMFVRVSRANRIIDLNESVSDSDKFKDERFTVSYNGNQNTINQDFSEIKIACKGIFSPFKTANLTELLENTSTYYLAGFELGYEMEKEPIILEQTFNKTDSKGILIFSQNEDKLLNGLSGGAILNKKGELVGIHNGSDTVVSGPNEPCSEDMRMSTNRANERKTCGTSIATLTKTLGTPISRSNSPTITSFTPIKNRSIVKSNIPIKSMNNERPIIYNQKPLIEPDYNVARGQRG